MKPNSKWAVPQNYHYQRKLGSNLPSYGQIELWDLTFLIIHSWRVVWDFKSHSNTSWRVVWDCETLHYIATHSWRVVWGFTSHNNTSWRMVWDCETLHYITIHSWRAEWDLTSHITSQNNAFGTGGVRLYIPLCITWLQNECCMGLVLGRKPEHETMRFSVQSGCRWQWKVPRVCGGCGCDRSATCGCSPVRSSMRLLTPCLEIAV